MLWEPTQGYPGICYFQDFLLKLILHASYLLKISQHLGLEAYLANSWSLNFSEKQLLSTSPASKQPPLYIICSKGFSRIIHFCINIIKFTTYIWKLNILLVSVDYKTENSVYKEDTDILQIILFQLSNWYLHIFFVNLATHLLKEYWFRYFKYTGNDFADKKCKI